VADLWAYDAEKNDWSEVAMNGAAPRGIVYWGLLVHDADHKCCLMPNVVSIGGGFQGGQVSGLFAFRLVK
jgi:ribulose 1,5-bisphosphate synthetase/thiazole synthase